MINGYQSINTLISKLYRDLGINTEIPVSSIIEWTAECLERIGTYNQFKEVKDCIEIVDGKAKLPVNFYKLKDIAFDNQPLAWSGNTMFNEYGCSGCVIPTCCTEHTFYINDSYIITDITDDEFDSTNNSSLCIIYLGVPVDSDGYPLVPDDTYFMEACAAYVTYRLDYQNWRKGQVTDKVYQASETNYLYYIKAAKGAANLPNAQQLENIKNVLIRLIPMQNDAANFYNNINKQERKGLH